MLCKEALPLIHEYLDGELESDQTRGLKAHLQDCTSCASRLRALEKTEAMIRVLDRPGVSSNLSAKVLLSLPPVRDNRGWWVWVRRHPAAAVAAAFVIIMISSFFSLWNQGTQLAVRGDDLEGIVIQDHRVIVPSNATVDGNLIVENGTIEVEGDVRGNIVVIDGSVALASTAHISGQITKVDKAMDWVWYKMNDWYTTLVLQP